MRSFARPKVVLSKCIEFANCRYDGSMIPSDFVKALKSQVDFIPICAEMEIGLGVPGDSIVANRESLDFADQARIYRVHLAEALKRPPRYTSKANVLNHSLGYLSEELSIDEKANFLRNI